MKHIRFHARTHTKPSYYSRMDYALWKSQHIVKCRPKTLPHNNNTRKAAMRKACAKFTYICTSTFTVSMLQPTQNGWWYAHHDKWKVFPFGQPHGAVAAEQRTESGTRHRRAGGPEPTLDANTITGKLPCAANWHCSIIHVERCWLHLHLCIPRQCRCATDAFVSVKSRDILWTVSHYSIGRRWSLWSMQKYRITLYGN